VEYRERRLGKQEFIKYSKAIALRGISVFRNIKRRNMNHLEDKVAIVTGAGQGIGEGIAKKLSAEGAKVIVSDINEDNAKKVAQAIGENAIGVKCDISNKSEVDNLIKQATEKFGKLDIMVNNAGIYPFKAFAEMTEEDWQKVQDVNLKGTFLTTQAATKVMKEGSKIVIVSSIAAIQGFAGLTHYCASKGGVNGFVRAAALELSAKKINVNAVAPGAINTPGVQLPEDQKQQFIAQIPVKRMGEPADIANAVAFLASDEADYITGQILVVDGGWTIQ